MIDVVLPLIALLTPPKPLPDYVAKTVARWDDLGVKVKVEASHCGMENAWYTFKTKTVTLCDELFDRPQLTRFILNHELGHAFMDQNGIPWIDAEAAADELAFFQSDLDEVYAGARWFLDMGGDEESDDGHPSDLDRAGSLLCLASAREGDGPRTCRVYYRSALSNWIRWVNAVLP